MNFVKQRDGVFEIHKSGELVGEQNEFEVVIEIHGKRKDCWRIGFYHNDEVYLIDLIGQSIINFAKYVASLAARYKKTHQVKTRITTTSLPHTTKAWSHQIIEFCHVVDL